MRIAYGCHDLLAHTRTLKNRGKFQKRVGKIIVKFGLANKYLMKMMEL